MSRTQRVVPATGASLVEVLDRVLARGAVVSGDVVISLAGVDLLRLDLRLLLAAIETAARDEGAAQAQRRVSQLCPPVIPQAETALCGSTSSRKR